MSIENTKLGSYLTLQNIVNDVLNDMGIYSKDEYMRYLQWAIRGFTQLNMFALNNVEVVYLTMNEAGVVNLPPDYLRYTKIGYNDNGNIAILGLNNDMSLGMTESCGVSSRDISSSLYSVDTYDTYLFSPHYYNGSYITSLYGMSGGYAPTYYRVYPERGIIEFGSNIPRTQIILEYISSGVSLSGVTYVPRQAQEAIIAWIHWKRKQNDRTYSRGEVLDAKQDYIEAVNELKSFDMPTAEEFMDVFYEGMKATPKR